MRVGEVWIDLEDSERVRIIDITWDGTAEPPGYYVEYETLDVHRGINVLKDKEFLKFYEKVYD